MNEGSKAASRRQRVREASATFLATELDDALAQVSEAEDRVLSLFHSAAREVPAYADFLGSHRIDSATVRTIADFRRVPVTTKDNYHRQNALAQLCRGGDLSDCDMLAVSSGSTGQPTVWPRFVTDEFSVARRFEQVLVDGFDADRRSTLAVIAFALGSWVGGMYTTACCRHLAAKGYRMTTVTPGNNIHEILRVLRGLDGMFDQVVLFGYPPFLKDVIDAGAADGFDWTRRRVRLVMAGEVFSESWRDRVCESLGANDPARATASLYGTADGGVLGNETPWSIRLRRALVARPEAARALFGEARLPTLCQYDPSSRFFEVEEGQLLFSGDGAVPLLRYRILDRGGIVGHEAMLEFIADQGLVIETSSTPDERRRPLPFVYVFGRSSFAVSFYGANVYPENVAPGLERPQFARHVTGKFVLEVVHDADENAGLHVTVELAVGVADSEALRDDVARSIQTEIERANSEFANYVPATRKRPSITLRPFGDSRDFPLGVKHRYVRST